jgi:hypothetical protein
MAFNSIPMKNSKKTFVQHQEMQIKNELTNTKLVEKIENAYAAEDYKRMQDMLTPLESEIERREKV